MRVLILLVLAAAGCRSTAPPSPYARITAQDGRVYYANTDKSLHSPTGGFLTFRDLVTGEQVRLKNGSYHAELCDRMEVQTRQLEYLENPR